MKTEWLRRVATALEVPVTACGSDLDMDRRPANSGEAPMLRLSDEDGVFLEVGLATWISTTRPDKAVTDEESELEEDDSRRTDARGRRTDARGRRTDARGQMLGVERQTLEVEGQTLEVEGQTLKVERQMLEVEGRHQPPNRDGFARDEQP